MLTMNIRQQGGGVLEPLRKPTSRPRKLIAKGPKESAAAKAYIPKGCFAQSASKAILEEMKPAKAKHVSFATFYCTNAFGIPLGSRSP